MEELLILTLLYHERPFNISLTCNRIIKWHTTAGLQMCLHKWINSIASSRWLWCHVPLPVIIFMHYWQLSSRELNLHCIPFTNTEANMHTHLHHSCALISINPFFHSALERLFHKLIGHTFNRLIGKMAKHARIDTQKWTWLKCPLRWANTITSAIRQSLPVDLRKCTCYSLFL